MSEHDIIVLLARSLDKRKYPFQLCNAFIYKWECDFWTLDTNGFTREYEVKISIQDYRKDAFKAKHKDNSQGANYFYYVCPTGLILPQHVAKGYGLIYVSEYEVKVIKKPTILHKRVYEDYKKLCFKYMWKWKELWFKQYWKHKGITVDQYHEGFITK